MLMSYLHRSCVVTIVIQDSHVYSAAPQMLTQAL